MAERLIDEAYLQAHKVHGVINNVEGDFVSGATIAHAPTVDAVSVVRCKACRYRGMIYCPAVHETIGNGLIDYTSDEAYCWRGRPKEYTNVT